VCNGSPLYWRQVVTREPLMWKDFRMYAEFKQLVRVRGKGKVSMNSVRWSSRVWALEGGWGQYRPCTAHVVFPDGPFHSTDNECCELNWCHSPTLIFQASLCSLLGESGQPLQFVGGMYMYIFTVKNLYLSSCTNSTCASLQLQEQTPLCCGTCTIFLGPQQKNIILLVANNWAS